MLTLVRVRVCVCGGGGQAWNDRNLVELSNIVESSLVFAHVRAASPGSLVSRENCHPFKYGRFSFMHNGCIAGFKQIKRALQQQLRDDVFALIEGTTDSEHAFALLMNQLPDPMGEYTPQQLVDAVRSTINKLLDMQKAAGVEGASSLNFAVTDGRSIIATRFRNHPTEEPPSLYYSYGTPLEWMLLTGVLGV